MKKQIRMISTVLIILTIICTLGNTVFAMGELIDNFSGDQTSKLTSTDDIQTLGNTIIGAIQMIGIIVAVVTLLVLGIKYMMGSAEEKAEYKKTMMPYLVGAALIFAGSFVVSTIYNMLSGLNK